MTATLTKSHTAHLAEYLAARGMEILEHGVQTEAGLLAIVMTCPDAWVFGHLRVADAADGFRPPIGAYSDEVRYRVRKQATAWFNERRVIPAPGVAIRVDAFGVLLDHHGDPAVVHHVPSAY